MVEKYEDEDVWPHEASSYKLEYVIGMGSFGIVWRAQVVNGDHAGQTVAVKVIDLDQFEDFQMADLRKESYMMLSSKHPNLVKEHATFIDCNYMWIVMNILDGGSLADIM